MENKRLRYGLWIAALFVAAGRLSSMADNRMNLTNVHVDSFTVAGIEARTSNEREMAGDGAIPKLWARLREENLPDSVPHRVDNHIVALYTDYESDKNGAYTYVLGVKVSTAKGLPAGLVARTVPRGGYAVFTARGESSAMLVVNLWKRIWSLEKPDQLYRAYKTDFEVYTMPRETNSRETRVDVYVGLRNK